MPQMPAISVIIINYNSGAERLSRCLAALAAQTCRDFEIILLDNASEDGSMAGLEETDHLQLLYSKTNLGFAGGVNQAAKQASGKWLALLNPDTIARPDWLAQLLAASDKYPDAAAFGSVQIDANDQNLLDGLGDVYHASGIAYRGEYARPASRIPAQDMEIFAPCAAACLYRRDLFEVLGGLAEDFFCYHEDVDFGVRLRLAGHKAVLVAKAVILHEGSGVTGRRSQFTVYHGTRNRIWTFIRTMPAPLIWVLLPVHVVANFTFLLRAISLGIGKPYLRGIRDGFLNSANAWGQRREIQQQRAVSNLAYARAMSWSPLRLLRRGADLRPLPHRPEGTSQ